MMKKWFTPMAAIVLVILMAGFAIAGGNSPFTQENTWIGAPCISDADCGTYKCCNSACAESCYFSEFKISSNDVFAQDWFVNAFQMDGDAIIE